MQQGILNWRNLIILAQCFLVLALVGGIVWVTYHFGVAEGTKKTQQRLITGFLKTETKEMCDLYLDYSGKTLPNGEFVGGLERLVFRGWCYGTPGGTVSFESLCERVRGVYQERIISAPWDFDENVTKRFCTAPIAGEWDGVSYLPGVEVKE